MRFRNETKKEKKVYNNYFHLKKIKNHYFKIKSNRIDRTSTNNFLGPIETFWVQSNLIQLRSND